MTPQLTVNLLRVLFAVFCLTVGLMVGGKFDAPITGAALGLVFGLGVVLADRLLRGVSLRLFSAATFGLVLGFLFAQLFLASDLFHYTDDQTRWLIGLGVYAACGYLGMMLAIRSNRDEFALIIPYIRFHRAGDESYNILADSSAIIDGRLPAVCAAGFLTGAIYVPRFVLAELQHLADSTDPKRRDAGRRGLDCLGQIQRSQHLRVIIHEAEPDAATPVDTRLVELAKALRARLLTNDANLAKIANIEQIPTLNFGDLARAMRPLVATGDEIEVELVREGRESHQAVGYLPDGSMVVVNQARDHLGKRVLIAVSGTVQTSGGRMVFGDLR